MFGKKKEEVVKAEYIVMPHKDLSHYHEVHPRICKTLEEAGRLIFDYPTLYQDVYELGKQINLKVELDVWQELE